MVSTLQTRDRLVQYRIYCRNYNHVNCWHCNAELIWGGDHDTEDNEDYDIVSNLSCPKCHSAVDVWHPSEKLIKEEEDYDKKSKRKKKK